MIPSKRLIRLESDAISFILQNKTKKTFVSFSGGKDSLVALDLAVRSGIKQAVFANTTIEYPETLEYIDQIRDFYRIKIYEVKSPKSFFEITAEIGFPSRRMRWCCEVHKFGPIALFAREHNVERFITGLRREESKRRKEYDFIDENPRLPIKQINPLLDWSKKDVWGYISKYKLPVNPTYKHFERVGCWCCPYRTKGDWEKNAKHYPTLMSQLNSELRRYCNKLGLPDQERFISLGGWTAWAPPAKKFFRALETRSKRNPSMRHINFFGDAEQIQEMSKFVRIVTNDVETIPRCIGQGIRITYPLKNRDQIRIVMEKIINCVGCGVCLSVCPTQALTIQNGRITLDEKKCTKCMECLRTKVIRSACIARNYSYGKGVILSAEKLG